MRKIFTTACICLLVYNCIAQNNSLDSLKTALANTNNPIERFALLNKIADYHFISGHGNVDSATCTEMLRIAQQLNNDSLLAIGYNIVGNYFFFYNGDYSKALEYFFKALPYAKKANDKRRISSVYIDIAQVYLKLTSLDEQLKYLAKASENLPDTSSTMYYYMLVQIQYQLSYHFYLLQKFDSALHFAQKLEESNFHFKSRPYNAAAYGILGNIYMQKRDTVFADIYWKRAIAIADSLDYTYAKFEVKKNYVDFLLRLNRIADAKKQAGQLMDIGMEKNNYDMQRIAAGFLRNIFDLTHQTDRAYYFSRLESAMKDSVFGESNLNKIQSLAFSEQLRIIEEQGKQAAEDEQRKKNIQYAAIAIGIITFIILFLLLSRTIIVKAKFIEFFSVLGLLAVFEFINLFIHPYLSHATNDSPVLMLLILIAIGAMLVPLHHRLEKWMTKVMVEKNKKIRLDAAKKTIANLEGKEAK